MANPETQSVVDWLVDGARSAQDAPAALGELCDRLDRCGIPLWRVAVFVRTLHPQVMGRRLLWRHGAGVEVTDAPHEIAETGDFRDSPIAHVFAIGSTLRRRLCDAACPLDFPVLREFRDDGVTDYIASPLVFTDGAVHAAIWSTRQPGGFTAAQAAAIEGIIAPLARVAEVRALRRTAGNLLDTYVGHHAGERILAGQIRRGDTESIDAAIWLSDMRGFTARADHLPPHDLIRLLNRYFDCQVPAIVDRGGEVLNFMGDGLLAIFRCAADGADAGEVCARALAAALAARKNIVALGRAAGADEIGGVAFGLALHLGNVLYGNIGGGNRLDFTCIGPAVNMAARIEKLAGTLGRSILASSDFARQSGAGLVAVGEFALAGFQQPQQVFGLHEEGA